MLEGMNAEQIRMAIEGVRLQMEITDFTDVIAGCASANGFTRDQLAEQAVVPLSYLNNLRDRFEGDVERLTLIEQLEAPLRETFESMTDMPLVEFKQRMAAFNERGKALGEKIQAYRAETSAQQAMSTPPPHFN